MSGVGGVSWGAGLVRAIWREGGEGKDHDAESFLFGAADFGIELGARRLGDGGWPGALDRRASQRLVCEAAVAGGGELRAVGCDQPVGDVPGGDVQPGAER